MKFRLKALVMVPAIFCLYYSSMTTRAATVKVTGWTLLDSGKHMDWSADTNYLNEFESAIHIWNSYKSGVIRKDTDKTKCDIKVTDNFDANGVAGQTFSNGKMLLNKFYMEDYGLSRRIHVCAHELGHALGLAHNTKKDIMYEYVTLQLSLSENDKASYNYCYKFK